jgi:hypothetical protein
LLTHWFGVTETNFDNLWILVLITNLSTLLPLPLLGWLPGADAVTSEPAKLNEQNGQAFDLVAVGRGDTVEVSKDRI